MVALGTACVGAAASLVLPFLSLEPTTGDAFNIIAFVVVVLGGMGNVIGALLGGLLIGVTQQVGGVVFVDQSNLLAVFILFVLALYLRPEGLRGRRFYTPGPFGHEKTIAERLRWWAERRATGPEKEE